MKIIRLACFCWWSLAVVTSATAQMNVRATYTNGQVFVVFQADPASSSASNTFALWFSPTVFTNTAQAALSERLFPLEVFASRLLHETQVAYGSNALTGFVIPMAGVGSYQLATNEGLFVVTVRTNLSGYFAVTPWGDATVSPARRTALFTANYSTNDSPQPHLQIRANSTTGHPVSFYILWADGAQDEASGRPDFPILANSARRGSPYLFLTVEPNSGLPGSGPWPATVCFHGSDGDAIEWLPNNATVRAINVIPSDSYVIAFDDEVVSLFNGMPLAHNSRWLGYVRSFDPFSNLTITNLDESASADFSAYNPPADETIVNYTQRRILWALDWLIAHANVDTHRVSVLGHSNGSMGAQMFTRAFPDRVSALELFNCGLRYFGSADIVARQGDDNLNLPVTLTNHLGQPVHLVELMYFTNRVAAPRDLPFTRVFNGKNDLNPAMHWGADMVDEIRFGDEQGTGLHFYWDMRQHGMNQWLDYWADSSSTATLALQSWRDDVRNQTRYRADQSFPAFFHLQNYPDHGNPGDGTTGSTTNSDDHGTWGGYFDWQTNLVDTPTNWQCTVFVVGTNSGYAAVDACPYPNLMADVAIRKSQQFLPAASAGYLWTASTTNGVLVQSGVGTTDSNALVTLPAINIPRDPTRLVLEVSAVPALAVIPTNATQIAIRAWLKSGFHFQLQNSTNLTAWSNLGNALTGSNAVFTATRSQNQPAEFYRLMVWP